MSVFPFCQVPTPSKEQGAFGTEAGDKRNTHGLRSWEVILLLRAEDTLTRYGVCAGLFGNLKGHRASQEALAVKNLPANA